MEIEQNIWGFTEEGEAIILYTMQNPDGSYVKLTNIGASVVAIGVPDKDGNIVDVALGYPDFIGYLNDGVSMGKSVGRFANRIAKGKFTLEGKEYTLAKNNGINHLHGGIKGFGSRLWQSRTEVNRVVFSYVSIASEERYPGEVGVEAVYDWDENHELEITYYAKSDSTTIINLTNHVYLNLKGDSCGDILSHILQLNASQYLETDNGSVPTGKYIDVEGTPMDFREEKVVGKDIEQNYSALNIGKGYDHCWVVDGWQKGKMCDVGYMYEPSTGINVDIKSTQPGVQVYTGNYLEGAGVSKVGKEYDNRDGIAIECQGFPDSINHDNFPSPVLYPDDMYEQHIIYKFSVK